MGGFYLDDFAVWVRTQKGSILRGVLCLALIGFGAFNIWQAFDVKDGLTEQIAVLDDTLAQDAYTLASLNQQAESMATEAIDTAMFTPSTDGGTAIATLQTQYSGFGVDALDTIADELALIRNGDPSSSNAYLKQGLVGYTANESLRNVWFSNYYIRYKWDCVSKQSVVINGAKTIPVIFKCVYNGTLIAVARGDFDMSTGLLSKAVVYTTYQGGKAMEIGKSNRGNMSALRGDILNYDKYNRNRDNWINGNTAPSAEDPVETVQPSEGQPVDGGTDIPPEGPGTGDGDNPGEGDGGDDPGGDEKSGGFDLDKILEGLR